MEFPLSITTIIIETICFERFCFNYLKIQLRKTEAQPKTISKTRNKNSNLRLVTEYKLNK